MSVVKVFTFPRVKFEYPRQKVKLVEIASLWGGSEPNKALAYKDSRIL